MMRVGVWTDDDVLFLRRCASGLFSDILDWSELAGERVSSAR